MKLIYLIIFAFTLNFAAAQDFWEEIELPSNRPVYDVIQDDNGKFYTSGLGFFTTSDFKNWQGINYFSVEFDDLNIGSRLDGVNNALHRILKFQDSVLIGLLIRNAAFISTNNGKSWDAIENINGADYITEYNSVPFIVSRDGIFKFNSEDFSFENLTDKTANFQVGSRVNNNLLINANFSDREMLYIFSLKDEEITDSVNKTELDIEGYYLETKDYAYVEYNNVLYVNDKPIRSIEDIDLKQYDLENLFERDFHINELKILKNGELFINNLFGGFIIASEGFNNYKYHQSPFDYNNQVYNIKIIEGEYFLCTSLGLYKTVNKNFENLEFLSENMGTGIYNYVNYDEINDEYHLVYNGVLSVFDGEKNTVKSIREGEIYQWDDKIYNAVRDTVFISEDFGNSWDTVHIKNSQYGLYRYNILHNNNLAINTEEQIAIINNETYEVEYIPQPSYGEPNISNFYLVDVKGDLYIFADDGLYRSYNKGESWEKIKTFDFGYELGYYLISNSIDNITNIGNVFILISYRGVLYSKDFGKSWKDLEFGKALDSFMEYYKSDDQILLTGNYPNAANTVKLTLNKNNDVEVEDLSEEVNNLTSGYLTKGSDGRIYASFFSGNYRSLKPITSVEDIPKLPTKENHIIIKPNISSDYINVTVNNTIDSKPKVYHITGKSINCPMEVQSINSFKIDIRNLDIGMYVIVDENSENPEGSFFFKE